MKKLLFFTLALVVACTAAMAVPAKPGIHAVTQPDGTSLQIALVGDEWHHSFITIDGFTVQQGDDGFFYYVTTDGISKTVAHDANDRSMDEKAFIEANREQMTLHALYEAKERNGMLRNKAVRGVSLKATQVPQTGSPRIPILLVQYTDKSMSNTKAQFETHYKTDNKSVYQYFVDQSNGLYTPQFDIYGIYTLPNNRATYGGNKSNGDDKGVAKMVGDAITQAGNNIDWSQYDNDGDGEVDVCIVVYAGVGEAQASYTVPNSIWPCQWSLSNASLYGDGPGAITRNGKKIDKFAVFNEIAGSSDNGTTMDGIGTFCHEFSHCLGLPDFYETTYSHGYFGMSYWSLMDAGCYNGGSVDGDTPIGYSAYEKNYMGWLNYITATENTFYTLPVFNSKIAENDKAVKISALNNNEYWILENRKKQGWDYYIEDEGILITHFTYDANRWSNNTVNNQQVQLATIIPADNSLSNNNLNKDLYGETNHAFGPNTTPAMKANMSANGTMSNSTGGAGAVNKPVTEITLNSDGTASFWYIKGEGPSLSVNPTSLAFEGYVGDTYTKTFTIKGSNLTGNVTVNKSGSSDFTVSPTTITAAQAQSTNGVNVTVTYAPTAVGNTNATLTLTSSGADNVTVPIAGAAQAATPTLLISAQNLLFSAVPGKTVTKTFTVSGRFIANDVNISLTDQNGVFSVSPTVISASQNAPATGLKAISEDNPTTVTVSFKSDNAGTYEGTLTISSTGAETKTISLNATAEEETGGTASDAYLDIAKYETITDEGWRNGYFNNLFNYAENNDEGVAWLTLPVYGAWASWNYQKSNGAANGNGPQRWITSTSYTGQINGNEMWNENTPFQGSSYYFTSTTAKFFGNTSSRPQDSSVRTITFYVTNASAVRLWGVNYSNNNLSNDRRCSMEIEEVDENLNQIQNITTQYGGTGSSATVNLSYNLEVNKIYRVTVSTLRTKLYEIGFATPLPSLTVNPEELDFVAEPGQTITQSFTVTGNGIKEGVNVALTDDNGVYSIPVTSISKNDAINGYTVDVTFTAPQAMGSYRGKVTLTSGNATAEVGLFGSVGEKGTAFSEYLDITKYTTIATSNWYSEYYDQPYKYTEDVDNECAWLTVPSTISYFGWLLNDQNWIGASQDANPYWYGRSWSASDVFQGNSYFYGSKTAYMFGPNVESSSAISTNTSMYYGIYNVTNCSQVKALVRSNAATSQYPAFIQIYELIENSDGSLTMSDTRTDIQTSSTNNTDVTLTSIELDPNKIYFVAVGSYRGFTYEVAFCTPMTNRPGVPTNVTAEPTATTSEITWTPGENNENWNLRWRPYVELTTETSTWNFENSSMGQWTTIDADGDGYNWVLGSDVGGIYLSTGASLAGSGHSPQDLIVSGSYSNVSGVGALTPDNYLVSPKVQLGGTITFWAKGQDADYPAEKFGVAVSTYGNTNAADFTMVGATKTATADWVQYTFDLSGYSGEGYVAIRHFGVTDQFLLDIDDIEITYPTSEIPEWNYVNDVESPYTITGLTPETTYEVQVQGVGDGGATSAWTPSTIFITLAVEETTLANLCEKGKVGSLYTISDQLIAVAYAEDTEGSSFLWCKDQGDKSIFATAIHDGEQVDFLLNDENAQNGRPWDQSNWVALKFTGLTNDEAAAIRGYVNSYIDEKAITGELVDDNNYMLKVSAKTLATTVGASYSKNIYCTSNFVLDNLNIFGSIAEGDGGYTSGNTAQNYFFMNPKVQEVCHIIYAMWDAQNSCFTVPTISGFAGNFNVDLAYNDNPYLDLSTALTHEKVYQFDAIVNRVSKTAYGAKGNRAGEFKVYPTNLTGGNENNPSTAINTVSVNREVVGVEYVNVAGMISDKPFQGVNIVVTRYSDGSKTTSKKVFK